MGPEYVTGQINGHILALFWNGFAIWFFHQLKNFNIFDKVFS